MKIKHIEYVELNMPLIAPYTIAYETVDKAENIILKLVCDNNVIGYGCAAPDLVVTGESCQDVIKNINSAVNSQLINQSPFQIGRHINELKDAMPRAFSTLAMVDMALYDLLAKKAQLPLYQILGGYKHSIGTSLTIGMIPL